MIRNAEHHADVQQQPDRLHDLQSACGDSPVNRLPSPIDAHAPDVVGEGAQRGGRGPEEEQRPQHVEDHEQDQPRPAGVRAVEPRRPLLALRRVADPDHREHAEREQAQHGDRVLQEAQRRPVADQRDREIGDEQRAVGLDVDREQDDERPEREEVRQPGHRPLQQPLLPEHLHQLGAQPPPAGPGNGPARAGPTGSGCRSSTPAEPTNATTTTVITRPMTSLTTTCASLRCAARWPQSSPRSPGLPAGNDGSCPRR